MQLAALVLSVILITIAGSLFSERGTIMTVFILCYALTSFLGGYVSGSFYSRAEGKVRSILGLSGHGLRVSCVQWQRARCTHSSGMPASG